MKLNIKDLLVSFVKKMTNLDHSVTRVSCSLKISIVSNDFPALVNRPFYSCVLSCLAIE